jgi:hypothetical protein
VVLEAADHAPRRPAMTEFRRRARYRQARWREANGHPVGTQPIVPKAGAPARPVGSRMPLAYAKETGANFVTPGALASARARTSFVETHQSFDHQALWARYVVLHPAANPDVTDLCARYQSFLADPGTFTAFTLDDLLAADALPPRTTAALRDRYQLD